MDGVLIQGMPSEHKEGLKLDKTHITGVTQVLFIRADMVNVFTCGILIFVDHLYLSQTPPCLLKGLACHLLKNFQVLKKYKLVMMKYSM